MLASDIVWFLVGAALGGVVVWLAMRARLHEATARLTERLTFEKNTDENKLALVQQALADRFRTLSAEVLSATNQEFLALAETKVEPLTNALERFERLVGEMEESRNKDVGGLLNQLDALGQSVQSLSRALSSPDTVGNWGQIQLRRVVELAGMQEHCDFDEQVSVTTDDGERQRPDVVVRLPGGGHVIIDAKVPRSAYLQAEKADDEGERREALQRHARLVRKHMADLGSKKYWEQFSSAPDWVVMFVPHEPFLSAACREDGQLVEDGFEKNRVIVATPLTLIALLYGFSTGWRQLKDEENAQEIARAGRELYRRIGNLAEPFRALGKSLTAAVCNYNKAVGSLERRVLPKAREFPALLNAREPEIQPLQTVDEHTRALHAPELLR